ncbi:predicted protein [Chaetoceros tenuissimus]|uniref:CBF1-interacting co-repressor CIR N-terminal domain-containing protein n=1 Tax=Chaetoceros tenuissimus TaxID=426638 RepID=A0AAD3DAZ4_9STRA|nr:predicted protein [Chaetoceros tenuissimus]
MSGRLIITTKKGYCPWSSKNVERVLRDERELKEREQKRKREVEQSERIEKLKRLNGDQDCSNDGASTDRHVNLFEQEEKKFLEDAKLGQATSRTSSKQVGIMPVFLSQMKKDDEQKQQENFYKKKDILRKETDDKLKKQMDPMDAFHNDETSRSKEDGDQTIMEASERVYRKEKKKKKSKKHKRHNSDHGKERNDSKDGKLSKLEELRKRKANRTNNELKREEKIQRL